MTVKGQDWSGYQAASPSAKGLDFVFIKATESTSYTNPRMNTQVAAARAAGAVVGFYHFLHGGNIAAQAAYFVTKAASVDGDLLYADWEPVVGGTTATSAEKDAFIKEVQRLRPTHRAGLYCNRDFWLNRDKSSFAGDGLWIADYNGKAGKPGITSAWTFHQYTSTPLDTNVGAFADKAALKAWASKTTPQEDDVALTAADIDKVAAAVVTKLIAGGGALENSDLDRIWKDDIVPAARPPYNNTDYYKADGKTLNNTTWTPIYALQTSVEAVREVLAVVQDIKTAIAGLGSGVDTATVVTAVQQAIGDAVVKVEITSAPKS